MLTRPDGYCPGSGVLEGRAAHGVEDLDGEFAGGDDMAFAGDPDDLFGVGKLIPLAAVRICLSSSHLWESGASIGPSTMW